LRLDTIEECDTEALALESARAIECILEFDVARDLGSRSCPKQHPCAVDVAIGRVVRDKGDCREELDGAALTSHELIDRPHRHTGFV